MSVEKLNLNKYPQLTEDNINHKNINQGAKLAENILNSDIIQDGVMDI